MVFELDSADLARNPFTMSEFANLLEGDSSNNLKANNIVIELSCANDVDRGDLYSVTYQLKQMGVMIALGEPRLGDPSRMLVHDRFLVHDDAFWCGWFVAE